jgi:Holliday junction DNA helicase RuvA
LRRKVPKFALMAAREEPTAAEVETDVIEESFKALLTVGHSERDARRLIDGVLAQKKKFKDVQEVLQAIYDKGQG